MQQVRTFLSNNRKFIPMAATALLLSSKAGYATQDEGARIQDTGRYAIEALSRVVRQASFENWESDADPLRTAPEMSANLAGFDASSLGPTGDGIDAAKALHYGLINKVVPKEKLMETARDYARKIAANAPLAVQAAKEMAVRSREMDRVTGLRFEAMTNRLLQFTEDAKEGPAAFAEKRPPNFKGR